MVIEVTFGEHDMAVWLDLLIRLEDGVNADGRLHCETIYRGAAMPAWMRGPFEDTIRNAGDLIPVMLVNVKGQASDDSLCILRLRELEMLLDESK